MDPVARLLPVRKQASEKTDLSKTKIRVLALEPGCHLINCPSPLRGSGNFANPSE